MTDIRAYSRTASLDARSTGYRTVTTQLQSIKIVRLSQSMTEPNSHACGIRRRTNEFPSCVFWVCQGRTRHRRGLEAMLKPYRRGDDGGSEEYGKLINWWHHPVKLRNRNWLFFLLPTPNQPIDLDGHENGRVFGCTRMIYSP